MGHRTQREGQMAFYNSCSILNPTKSQERMGADKTFSVCVKVLLDQAGKGTLLASQYLTGGDVGVALIVLWL